MTSDIALYPGERGTGKTTLLMEQVRQAAVVGQSVAIVVPTSRRRSDLYWEMKSWDNILRKPEVFSEVNLYTSRGLRLDQIFIDDADMFQDNPAEIVGHLHPGVPLTMTYTPREGSALDTSINR